MALRQQVLYLWLANSSLDAPVTGWSFYDGTSADTASSDRDDAVPMVDVTERPIRLGRVGSDPAAPDRTLPETDPPYESGLDALRAGWMLLQSSQIDDTGDPGAHTNSYLRHEFVFERRLEC